MKLRFIFALLLMAAAGAGIALAAESPAIWIDVPYIAQAKDGCGSASISMVMQYWENKSGRAASPSADAKAIQSALFSSSDGGILASKMQDYFRESGYRIFAFQGAWSDLEHHIRQGRPLIVGLK